MQRLAEELVVLVLGDVQVVLEVHLAYGVYLNAVFYAVGGFKSNDVAFGKSVVFGEFLGDHHAAVSDLKGRGLVRSVKFEHVASFAGIHHYYVYGRLIAAEVDLGGVGHVGHGLLV